MNFWIPNRIVRLQYGTWRHQMKSHCDEFWLAIGPLSMWLISMKNTLYRRPAIEQSKCGIHRIANLYAHWMDTNAALPVYNIAIDWLWAAAQIIRFGKALWVDFFWIFRQKYFFLVKTWNRFDNRPLSTAYWELTAKLIIFSVAVCGTLNVAHAYAYLRAMKSSFGAFALIPNVLWAAHMMVKLKFGIWSPLWIPGRHLALYAWKH